MPGCHLELAAPSAWSRGALLYCGVGLLAMTLPGPVHAQAAGHWAQVAPPGAAPTPTPAPLAADDPLTQRGWRLRAEIDATYQELRATNTLTHRVDQPNDVTPVVLKYIPVGTTFDEAAAILRAAGCSIGVDAQGHGYGTLAMKDGLLQVKHTLAINLVPQTPHEFSVIGEVNGIIFEKYQVKSALK